MTENNRLTPEQVNESFRRLRALKKQHEGSMNKDELAELLICAAITEGFDSGTRITGTLAKIDMHRQHAGIILNRLTGTRWRKRDDGRYTLIGSDNG